MVYGIGEGRRIVKTNSASCRELNAPLSRLCIVVGEWTFVSDTMLSEQVSLAPAATGEKYFPYTALE